MGRVKSEEGCLQGVGMNPLPNLAALSLNSPTPGGLQQLAPGGLHEDAGVLLDPYGYGLAGQGPRMMLPGGLNNGLPGAMPGLFYQQ